MPLKRQFTYLKKAKKLAKQRKIEVKNNNILIENISILLKDKFIKDLLVYEKDISCHK